jgi:RecA-family ATPase
VFDLNYDLSRLRTQIDAIGGVTLIIIDPITAYLGKKDTNNNADVRGILAQLAQLAESSCACVLAISHFNKDSKKKADYRISGSLGFSAAARTVFS